MSRTDLSVQWLNNLNTCQQRLFSVVQTQVKTNDCRNDDYDGSFSKYWRNIVFLSSIFQKIFLAPS